MANNSRADIECVECNKMVRSQDKALACDLCEQLFCYMCTGVKGKTYEVVSKAKEEGISWICKHCRISLPGAAKLNARMKRLESSHQEILKELKEIKENKTADGGDISKTEIEKSVNEMFREQQERLDRKYNVMCFGMGESTKEDAVERKKEDQQKINEMIQVALGEDNAVEIQNPIRIGKREMAESEGNETRGRKKIRPVKIIFGDLKSKNKALDALRDAVNVCRTGKYQYIYFQHDLTAMQRAEAAEKRRGRLMGASQGGGRFP